MKSLLVFLSVFVSLTFSGIVFESVYIYQDYPYLGALYTCYVSGVIDRNSANLIEIRGEHKTGKSDIDVQGLHVNLAIQLFPKNFERVFPNLVGFKWWAHVPSLTSEDLKPFTKLISLDLGYNRFVTLESDLFKYSPKLKFINFENNKLEHIGQNLLTELKELTFANFHTNPCINASASTHEEIEILNDLLPIQCPPLNESPATTESTTTESTQCSPRCSLNDEADKLTSQVNEQQEEILSLKKMNAAMEKRVTRLEEIIKEIQIRP